ncbi:hypothetical protein CANARDRAFT_26101 [[Candida] arabinofermentans NRRL YB-2248]|uniref:non-specific serine/threonine protein kinase n=1 Tax=[Candida] arabinofermentans NRRL YB-2248 TaxID=983967 RepID=A0A1E4T853_9ASCO|nr:hypothetical protein CANARDRAFT_26101 [[Candida] arabinofermentans NRRL YB-2248]
MDEYSQYERSLTLLQSRYKFHSNLQNGSFGKVTCAIDIHRNQKVAIKSLKKTIPGITQMTNHEIKVMKQLGEHEQIVQLLDHFETKKYIILVLEFVEDGDLYDAIHNQTILGLSFQNDSSKFIKLLNQLYSVLTYTQSKGVYHRDIKPENILLTSNGDIKLCDWGLASLSQECNDFNIGTEKYMSPESLTQTTQTYDAIKSDTWSLGITLLFTLFGKCPFRKASLSDFNYMKFTENCEFLLDYYPSINMVSFIGIVKYFLIERDLVKGLEYLTRESKISGLTIDQEHYILSSLSHKQQQQQQHQLHHHQPQFVPLPLSLQDPIVSGTEELGGEFFMFDQDQLDAALAPIESVDDFSLDIQHDDSTKFISDESSSSICGNGNGTGTGGPTPITISQANSSLSLFNCSPSISSISNNNNNHNDHAKLMTNNSFNTINSSSSYDVSTSLFSNVGHNGMINNNGLGYKEFGSWCDDMEFDDGLFKRYH